MDKYILDGEEYIYSNGRWLTSNYTSAPVGLLGKLNKMLASKEDLETKTFAELMEIADGATRANMHPVTITMLNTRPLPIDCKGYY